MHHPQRLHALDNLRAVMMWLGIVLHAAVNHIAGISPLPWRDPATSKVADLVVIFIHTFRMPVFFIVGGFFVAMLVSRDGDFGMLKHRMRRIGLPFMVFWPLVYVGASMLAMLYIHLMVKGSVGIDPNIMPVDPHRPLINTWHMWFLYYLLWFCVLTAIAGRLGGHIPATVKEGWSKLWLTLATTWWGFIVLSVPLGVVGAWYEHGILKPSGSFIPQFSELLHNGMFFVVGLVIYRYQEPVLRLYSKHAWRLVAAGFVFFMVVGGVSEHFQKSGNDLVSARITVAYLYNCATWLWSFALIGLFTRYLTNQNRFLRYLSESSYWVYLMHMFGTIGFGVLLYDMPLPAMAKLGINIAATTLACVASYHFLVRNTFVGVLLNGRRAQVAEADKLRASVSAT